MSEDGGQFRIIIDDELVNNIEGGLRGTVVEDELSHRYYWAVSTQPGYEQMDYPTWDYGFCLNDVLTAMCCAADNLRIPALVDEAWLNKHPGDIFVYGDNTDREGLGGAASLRHHPQSYGFVTKIHPDNHDASFYRPDNYLSVYVAEIVRLRAHAKTSQHRRFLISAVGAGLANKYGIFEEVIKPTMKVLLSDLPNIVFLW